jgi:hypothetical protein
MTAHLRGENTSRRRIYDARFDGKFDQDAEILADYWKYCASPNRIRDQLF